MKNPVSIVILLWVAVLAIYVKAQDQVKTQEQGPVVGLNLDESKQLEIFRLQRENTQLRFNLAQLQYQTDQAVFNTGVQGWLNQVAKTHKVDKVELDKSGMVRVVPKNNAQIP